jgi:hypothetical protein
MQKLSGFFERARVCVCARRSLSVSQSVSQGWLVRSASASDCSHCCVSLSLSLTLSARYSSRCGIEKEIASVLKCALAASLYHSGFHKQARSCQKSHPHATPPLLSASAFFFFFFLFSFFKKKIFLVYEHCTGGGLGRWRASAGRCRHDVISVVAHRFLCFAFSNNEKLLSFFSFFFFTILIIFYNFGMTYSWGN